MGLHIIKGDILSIDVDAVVNSTNMELIGYSGVDQLIHKIGGQKFEEECEALAGTCYPGEAVYTNAYLLHCQYVIHTVVPVWKGGVYGEAAVIRSCYRSSLEQAEKLGCKSVAFPLLCAGSMGCPARIALESAVRSIRDFFDIFHEMEVWLVLHDSEIKRESDELFGDLDDYIEKMYVPPEKVDLQKSPKLKTLLAKPGEDFRTMLKRLMEERGYRQDSELYNKAYLTRASFSKIKNGGTKTPSKTTIIKLAMAMQLSFNETAELLASAGYAFSNDPSDIVMAWFIKNNQRYDVIDLDLKLENLGLPSILEE